MLGAFIALPTMDATDSRLRLFLKKCFRGWKNLSWRLLQQGKGYRSNWVGGRAYFFRKGFFLLSGL